jgi:demethylmenaquinone methyltransferase/2-methoxy-6-polyprenyl-1,4-benzoquinol methylase
MTSAPFFQIPRWFGRQGRRRQLDEFVDRSRTAAFGSRQMAVEQKVEAVMRHFDRVAPRYDFMNSLLSFGIQMVWKRAAVALTGIKSGSRVLDVCGGTADLSLLAAGYAGAGGRLVVCDLNRAMMRHGRAKVVRAGLADRIGFVQGDAERLPFPDAAFDAAMVGFGIRNLTHLKQGFREMHRVLRPGGIFMCLEFSRPTNPLFRILYDLHSFAVMPFLGQVLAGNREGYRCLPETIRRFALPEELKGILEQIGFQAVAYRRFTNGIAVAHTGRKSPS